MTAGAIVTMLGATVMSATAASLNNYPDMMVTDGVFDGLMVVGENAAAVDNLALTDLASSMKYKKAGSSSSVSVEGDAWRVGTSAKKLEMANSNTTSSTIAGEGFTEMSTFIGSEELDGLADGSYATNSNSYDYQQFLFFDALPNAQSGLVKYDESDEDVTADYLYFKSGYQIGRYKLEMSSSAQSDVTDADGAATTTGDYLDDFRKTDLMMFGKQYSIVDATRPATGDTTSVKLTLMAGSARDTLLEGESKTYTVKNTEYEVALSYVDATKAKFTVNGETTNKLAVGETYVLADGSEVGVAEVLYQAYAGGVHSAEFYVGAQKMELRDDNSTTAGGTYNLKVGSEDIDGTTVIITGTDDGTTVTLSTIELNMSADDDFWVPAGGKLSENPDLSEPQVLFAGAFDVEYKGLSEEEIHQLSLKTSSSRKYKFRLYDGEGKAVDLPVAYAEAADVFHAGFNVSMGEDTWAQARGSQKRLILGENGSGIVSNPNLVYKNDYFVVTSGTSSDGSAKSYLLQYKGADKNTKTSPKIQFKNMGTGETMEYSATTVTSTATVATLKLGGYSFIVQNASVQTGDDYQVIVDLNGGGSFGTNNITFVDYYGSEWTHKYINNSYITWTQSTPNSDDYDNILPSAAVINITSTTGPEVRGVLTGFTLITPDGETEVSYGYSSMGTFVTYNQPSGDPQQILLDYPAKQRLPQVYITSGATTTTSSSGGELVAVTVVDATKLDSEVASVTAQNLLVVGGPCVNTVSAELLGNPADCTEGFTPGKSRVKLFEHANGNVAMLVAGYSGADTRLAGKVLANTNKVTSAGGMEVEIEGTTYSDAVVSKPALK